MTRYEDIPQDEFRPCVIFNFRLPAGLKRIYRCGMMDDLADIISGGTKKEDDDDDDDDDDDQRRIEWLEPERIVLQDATLIIDLRDGDERRRLNPSETTTTTNNNNNNNKNDSSSNTDNSSNKMERWTQLAPGGPIPIVDMLLDGNDAACRQVLQLGMLGRKEILQHIDTYWLNHVPPQDRTDPMHVNRLRIQEFNKRGIPGMYEIIMGQSVQVCTALQSITVHLEQRQKQSQPPGIVVVHCTQGKDRTAIIIMLCQVIVGLEDSVIIQDYALSEGQLNNPKALSNILPGLDYRIFTRAPRDAMATTLQNIRNRHEGSIDNYLDAIGFDEPWRRRLAHVLSW